MPIATRAVFDRLYNSAKFKETGATLMGDTALSLLIGHRLSEDLDFFFFKDVLPKGEINATLNELRIAGFDVQNIMDQARISQARINGIFLDDLIQEYAVNGVKLSFAVMSKGARSRKEYFKERYSSPNEGAFFIPDLKTLFESKAVVLMDRVQSRDLFDLMVLINDHGFSVQNIIEAIVSIDDVDENEAQVVCEILTGNVPVDKDDPGFESIDLSVSLKSVYKKLSEQVNKYEQEISRAVLTDRKRGRYPLISD